MKVAFVTRDYPPSVGGISTHSSNLVRELRTAGVEVEVYVGHTDANTLLLPLRVRLDEYDLVHVQSAPYGAAISGTTLVVTVHSPIPTEFSGYGMVSKLKSVPSLPLEALSLTKARSVLAVSEATRDEIVQAYRIPPGKVTVIGNGVGQEFFSSPAGRRSAKRILMVSRLEPRKNVLEAIHAICRLPPRVYEAQVVGSGSQLELLSSVVEKEGANVAFLGRVENQALPSIYASAGIFLTTSLSEGFGLSLLEAMASGCAVLASDISTHRSLITHGVNGMLYSSLPDLQKTLTELLSSPTLQEQLGEKARETASSYTWKEVSSRVLAAYRQAV